jgi:glycosyltransferase involved in cell wall biosynthesis
MSRRKVAFLYSEIAGYFLANVKELSKSAEVLIFRWPINKEAPFKFDEILNVTIIDRSGFDQNQLEAKLKDFKPDIIVCSGWMDKGYIKAVKAFKKKTHTVLTLDNHWAGTIKQRIAAIVSPFYLKKIFTHAWVPGNQQAEFADKLGFKGSQLIRDFYCADVALFQAKFEETFTSKRIQFPKRFLYVARYLEHKGIFEMWNAFKELTKEERKGWELWCIGAGKEWENRIEGEGIRHVGFVQPVDLGQYLKETGVYILPSKFEPWGVTVQEFAISGFPMIVSDAVGAKTKYLKENGISVKAGSQKDLKEAMMQFISMSDADLISMGEKSNQIGSSFNSKMWVDNLISII